MLSNGRDITLSVAELLTLSVIMRGDTRSQVNLRGWLGKRGLSGICTISSSKRIPKTDQGDMKIPGLGDESSGVETVIPGGGGRDLCEGR